MIVKDKSIYKELIDRWKSESPEFWEKIKKYSVILGTSSLGIISLNEVIDLQALGVPAIIFKICGYILTFCAASGIMAKITKKDDSNIQ